QELIEMSNKFRASVHTDDVKAAFERFQKGLTKYQEHRESNQYAALLKGEKEKGQQASVAGGPIYEKTYRALQDALRGEQEAACKLYENSQAVYISAWRLVVGMVAGGILLAVVLGVMIARAISTPLQHTVQILESVARGDLSQQTNFDST